MVTPDFTWEKTNGWPQILWLCCFLKGKSEKWEILVVKRKSRYERKTSRWLKLFLLQETHWHTWDLKSARELHLRLLHHDEPISVRCKRCPASCESLLSAPQSKNKKSQTRLPSLSFTKNAPKIGCLTGHQTVLLKGREVYGLLKMSKA